ncbi:MBL fold metallo-hydrolase [Natronolimnohabitans innermongolicus]|uniref:Hydrolase (Hydroxyacylglutathione hydrolase) 11 n=1 Tax=Natronolimnohabitans innermongolicus JCM 12255 TaxID=1227499 RepID=L9WIR2_9EURY|nr:MBL fold metallo-hydrolase [Natronolimnohabitans innermongolicus]ELY49339.1 hydrolase (hydroxyacylglutathione hydrolase) 11 [Natronolimnohabitans innermongolicus JCM 12255]
MSQTNQPDADSDCSAVDDARPAVHRLEVSVDWPPGHAAAYLLAGAEPILVDAGMPGERGREELLAALEGHGYAPDDIDHLLLTHSHTDHVGQTGMLLEAGDPTVYAPKRIRARFERDLETVEAATRRNLVEAGVGDRYLDDAVERLLEAHESNRDPLPLEGVDRWIDGDDRVEIGGREVEPIYTPGHHVAHHCYGTTLGDERVLFAGDMAIDPFRSAAINVNFDDGVREGVDAYLDGLERLHGYSFDRVYPGHGPVHTNYAETVERSITDLEDRIEGCFEALEAREGPATATAIGDDVTDSFSERARVLPEIVSALARLEREGRVESWLEEGVRYYGSLDRSQ